MKIIKKADQQIEWEDLNSCHKLRGRKLKLAKPYTLTDLQSEIAKFYDLKSS